MRRSFRLTSLGVAFVVGMVVSASGAFAQPVPPRESPGGPSLVRASDLIGMPVANPRGESLGRVQDVVLERDVQRGRVAYVAMAFGGWMGVTAELHAVPLEAFEVSGDGRTLMLDVRAAELEVLPGFDPNRWPDQAQPAWANNPHIERDPVRRRYWRRDEPRYVPPPHVEERDPVRRRYWERWERHRPDPHKRPKRYDRDRRYR